VTRLRVGTPVTVAGVELIPIERTHVGGDQIACGLVVYGAKEPAAVVIRSRLGDWAAFDLNGRRASLTNLLHDVPGLRERIDRTS
jgi:hypothetical protein